MSGMKTRAEYADLFDQVARDLHGPSLSGEVLERMREAVSVLDLLRSTGKKGDELRRLGGETLGLELARLEEEIGFSGSHQFLELAENGLNNILQGFFSNPFNDSAIFRVCRIMFLGFGGEEESSRTEGNA
jgi:hypothetical protein